MALEIETSVARPEDRANLISLLEQAGLPTDDVTPALVAALTVAKDVATREIAGLVGLERFGEVGLLRSLVVAPAARGSGLGRQLVEHAEHSAKEAGISQLWLLTIDADRFFAAYGYREASRDDAPASIRESREFSELCPDDAVLMNKSL